MWTSIRRRIVTFFLARFFIVAKVSQQKLQSFTAKAKVVYRHAITAKVSQKKLQSFKAKTNVVFMYVVRQSVKKVS